MIILAIDTSLADVSAAVSREPGHIESESFRHERDALRRLTGVIADVLQRSGVTAGDIELVVCTRGPGSFTGLRVGVAAAKALAAAACARIAGPSTLEMLAANVESPGAVVVPLIEACPGEVYCAAYRVGDAAEGVVTVAPDRVCAASDLPEWIRDVRCTQVLAIGPALSKYAGFLGPARMEDGKDRISIRRVIEWGRRAARSGEALDAVDFQAEYLRVSQAEIRRLRDAGMAGG